MRPIPSDPVTKAPEGEFRESETGGLLSRNLARASSILLLISLVAVSSALLGWIAADHFVDREEAQHVLRAIATFDGLFTRPDPPSTRILRLIEIRDGGHKQWYGWPYYLVVSLSWRALDFHEDIAVGLNVLFLIAAALLVRLIAQRLGAALPGANTAALFLLFAPGGLVYAHMFVPSVFLLLLVSATAFAILRTDGWSRPGVSTAAGALAALATVSKATLFFCWIPFAIWAVFHRRDKLFSRERVLSVSLAVLAFSFAPLTFWRGRHVLGVWRDRLEALWSAGGWPESLSAAAIRWGELLLPVHMALVLFALITLVASRKFEKLALCVAATLLPVIGVIAASGQPGTVRDYIPALLGPALLVGIAMGQGPRRAILASCSIFIFGAFFLPINLFGWLVPEDASRKGIQMFRAAVEGVPFGIRLTPYPDLVGSVVEQLEALPLESVSERCGCVSAHPYPVAGSGERALIGLDSLLLGPENLQAWLRLRERPQAWQFGIVPYPLHCPAFRLANHCMAALVIDKTTLGAHYPTAEALAAVRRPNMKIWGELVSELQLGIIPPVQIRMRGGGESICSESASREQIVSTLFRDCTDGEYYAGFIRYEVLNSDSPEASSIRAAARLRAAQLDAGADPMAVVFGERYLTEWTLAALGPSPSKPLEMPASTTSAAPITRPQALPDSAFRVGWGLTSVPSVMKAGETLPVAVKVRNLGPVAWPDPLSIAAKPVGAFAVRLSSRWTTSGKAVTEWSERAELERPLAPGDEATMLIDVAVPNQPGHYILQFDLVQELLTWFSDRGADKALVHVEVTP